jgi:DnaK suppressor protein
MTEQQMTDGATARAQLLARRAELEALSETAREARDVVQLDQQSVGRLSRMDAMQGQAMALANERQRTAELGRIAAALHRLDTGAYGDCLECGDAIAPRRLAVDPAAALCIACAGRN